jgi:hypothetical protein
MRLVTFGLVAASTALAGGLGPGVIERHEREERDKAAWLSAGPKAISEVLGALCTEPGPASKAPEGDGERESMERAATEVLTQWGAPTLPKVLERATRPGACSAAAKRAAARIACFSGQPERIFEALTSGGLLEALRGDDATAAEAWSLVTAINVGFRDEAPACPNREPLFARLGSLPWGRLRDAKDPELLMGRLSLFGLGAARYAEEATELLDEPKLKGPVVDLLARIGPKAASAAPRLRELLKGSPPSGTMAALASLRDTQALPLLVKRLADSNGSGCAGAERQELVQAVAELSKYVRDPGPAVFAVADGLRCDSEEWNVLDVLQQLGHRAEAAAPVMIAVFHDAQRPLQYRIALGRAASDVIELGPRDRELLDALVQRRGADSQ